MRGDLMSRTLRIHNSVKPSTHEELRSSTSPQRQEQDRTPEAGTRPDLFYGVGYEAAIYIDGPHQDDPERRAGDAAKVEAMETWVTWSSDSATRKTGRRSRAIIRTSSAVNREPRRTLRYTT